MRATFCREVEKSRAAGIAGDRNGVFLLRGFNGVLLKVIASDASGWEAIGLPEPRFEHVSVSTTTRCPTWEEMALVKDWFFEPEECVIQFHPPRSKYVNDHQFVLHLWRPVGVTIPLPPLVCV